MNFARRPIEHLRSRFDVAVREFAKFGIIGGFNTVLDIALWNILVKFVMPDGEVKAKILASLVAATSSYFMNRHWAFRHRTRSAMHREYVMFFVLNGIGLAIQTAGVAIAKYGFGIDAILWLNVINLGSLALGTAFRFWSYRRFVWLKPEPDNDNAIERANEKVAETADQPALTHARLATTTPARAESASRR